MKIPESIGVMIGNFVDEKNGRVLSKTISDVFESGFKNHMSDAVLSKALDVVGNAFMVSGTTVSNNVISGGKNNG